MAWCYSDHPLLCSAMGILRSESGVQQGDPLGPLLFLVLHKLVSTIEADSICLQLLFHLRYMYDGVIAGSGLVALQVFNLIQQLGSSLGLFINTSKCELFSRSDLGTFLQEMRKSNTLSFEKVGAHFILCQIHC